MMDGIQDEIQEKDRKLDADLKGKLDFFIWHQRFKRNYKTWSDAPTDLKAPYLLAGKSLTEAEGWLLSRPSKLSDGERRFIMRSLAQSTQRAITVAEDKDEGRSRRPRSAVIPLFAATVLVAAVALPRFLLAPPRPIVEKPIDVAAASAANPAVQSSTPAATPTLNPTPTTVRSDAVPALPPANGPTGGLPQPAGASGGDPVAGLPIAVGGSAGATHQEGVPVPVEASAPAAATEARQAAELEYVSRSELKRLISVAERGAEGGERRLSAHAALAAVEKLAVSKQSKQRDDFGPAAISALITPMTIMRETGVRPAATSAVPTALLCGDRRVVTAHETAGGARSLVAFDMGSEPAKASRAVAAKFDQRLLLKGASVDSSCQRLVLPVEDDAAEIWSIETGQRIARLDGHDHDLVSAAFSPDGRLAVTTSQDKTARIYDAATGRPLRALVGHDGSVLAVGFSSDGRLVATASADRTVRVFDTASGRDLATIGGHLDAVTGVAISPDDRRLLTTSRDGTARLSPLGDGRSRHSVALRSPGRSLLQASFDRSGQRVFGLDDDGALTAFDAAEGSALFQFATDGRQVRQVVVHPTLDLVLAVMWQGEAVLFDALTGHSIATLVSRGRRAVTAAFGEGGGEASVLLADGSVVVAPVFSDLGSMISAGRVFAGQCPSADAWKDLDPKLSAQPCHKIDLAAAPRWLATAPPRRPEGRQRAAAIEVTLNVEDEE